MRVSTGTATGRVRTARNAVLATFFLNGFAFATWASRIPSVRQALDLGPGRLGLLLLARRAASSGCRTLLERPVRYDHPDRMPLALADALLLSTGLSLVALVLALVDLRSRQEKTATG